MAQDKKKDKIFKAGSKKKKAKLFIIEEENELLKFLYQNLGKSNKIKLLLKEKYIKVNDKEITQYNHPLKIGDKVIVNFEKESDEKHFRDISIIYEDKYIIVIDKHAGLLSISTAKENKRTAYRILSKHVKLQDAGNLIFVVHRLDRDTSGLMMFAKSLKVQEILQKNWKDIVTERTYMALIKGKPEPWSNSITSYLHESKALIVYSSNDPESGQLATTHYKILKSRKEFTILKVWLETGRKNQIRVHLRDIGFPIVGDKKYGSEIDPIGRLGLHAWILNFKHPITGELMEFKTDIPRKFARLV
jgi:23S rRNA pseudouridine1911/1915/1917 synthase